MKHTAYPGERIQTAHHGSETVTGRTEKMFHNAARSIAVVVVNYNSASYSLACLRSVLDSRTRPDRVIIVDNNSPDGSVARLASGMRSIAEAKPGFLLGELTAGTPAEISASEEIDFCRPEKLWLIRSPLNKGYAGGNNLGMTLALRLGVDAVWILNSDTEVDPHALDAMRCRLFSSPRPGLCGGLVVYAHTPGKVQCRGGGTFNRWTGISKLNGQNIACEEARRTAGTDVEKELDFIYGASVMASRRFIETVGLMDERYFMYCEEQDWAYNAKGRFDLVYAPEAVIYHHEGASTGWPGKVSTKVLLRLTSSRLKLLAKHNPLALPLVCCYIFFSAIRLFWRRTFCSYWLMHSNRLP